MADPEVEAMSAIADALNVLDTDAQQRIVKWVIDRYAGSRPPAELFPGSTTAQPGS